MPITTVRAKEPEELKEPVTYFSRMRSHTHTLRPTRTIIIDGYPVKEPGMRIQFRDSRFTTSDPEIVKAMDRCLRNKKWSAIMYRGPTKAEVERASRVAKKIKKAREKIIEEEGPPKPLTGEGNRTFKEFVEERKKVGVQSAQHTL